jgi:hypothetical protein
MTDDEKLAIVAELYASTGAGDFDTAESLLTDDFFIIEAEGLPMAADLEPEGMSVGGDYVVNLISFRFENPDLASAQLAEVFRFRGDKVCEIRPYYFDPKPIVDAWAYYSNAAD